ncbi:DoxX family protein [Streptomyces purpurogeneiscleroticus]|nr:DoxX family protein [Streptomyces purpurogeneiscleroticus]
MRGDGGVRRVTGQAVETGRRRLRYGLAALYAFIGVVHLVATDAMLPLMPDWVPQPRLVILATGLCEIAGAVGLLTGRFRRAAALGLALYAVCVYPANLKHAFDHVAIAGIPDSWWYHGPRLAFQPVFVWAALWAGGLIDWPFGGDRGSAGAAPRTARAPQRPPTPPGRDAQAPIRDP